MVAYLCPLFKKYNLRTTFNLCKSCSHVADFNGIFVLCGMISKLYDGKKQTVVIGSGKIILLGPERGKEFSELKLFSAVWLFGLTEFGFH